MHRLVVVSLSALLVLAGCGGDGDGGGTDLGSISVSKAATPKVKVAAGTTATKTETRVVEEGSGDELADGDSVKLNYLAINGRTGKQFDSSFAAGRPSTFTLSENGVLPGFIKALRGQKVGSRVLAVIPPADGFDQARSELGLKKDDTMVFVFDVVSKVPAEATGKAKALPKDLPKLTLDGDDHPSGFTKTSTTAKRQTKASAHVVIQGDGPEIEENQTLSVQYVGQVYPAGKVFDTSWSRGAAASFQLTKGQLIDCWTDLLKGQRVGSRVVLVCPSDVAYGEEGSPPDIKGGDTLLFAIDLLDAS